MRLSASFTALGSLIRPPKVKAGKKGWWGRRQARILARQLKAVMGANTAAAEAAATAAVLEEEVRRRDQQKDGMAAAADGKVSSSSDGASGGGAAPVRPAGWRSESGLSEGDDPFASMAFDQPAGEAPSAVLWGEGEDVYCIQLSVRSHVAKRLPPPPLGPADASAQRPVVGLTDAELLATQVMARHLSVVVSRNATEALRGAGASLPSAALAPLLVDGAAGAAGAASAGASGACGDAGAAAASGGDPLLDSENSQGLGGLSGGKADKAARGEWVLRKLHGLVDAVSALEKASLRERESQPSQGACRRLGSVLGGWACGRLGRCRSRPAHSRFTAAPALLTCRTSLPPVAALPSAAGLPAFMLVVHACTTLTRQCCACLTALDPQRGAQLHAHYMETRKPGRLLSSGGVVLS